MRVEIVTIGDELLLGLTVDTNASHVAQDLSALGVEIVRRATVGDNPSAIASAVGDALERTGAVITTGGLGPTSDDLTRAPVAGLFGRELVRNERIVDALRARWAKLRRTAPFPEANLTQAMIPEGALILANPNGTACGIWLEDERGRWVAMLPGVPREMREMVANELIPRLVDRIADAGAAPTVIKSRTLRTVGVAESSLADELGKLAGGVAGMPLSFLPGVEGVDLRITCRGLSLEAADLALAAGVGRIRTAVGRYVYGEDGTDLAEVVLDLCRQQGQKIAVAESCTGGMLGARLTAIPGSSDVFLGGVVAYDDAVKKEWLGVQDEDLAAHGAVSEVVARIMAREIRTRFGAGIGVAITGIAGPGGGTADKPVGTIWIAVDGPAADVRCRQSFGTRQEIRMRAAQAALDMVRRILEND